MIDLRSDTVTRPTTAMKEAMFAAPLGDDVFAEDPTVNALESKTAALFGKEAGLFCPSGTMTNQIGIKVHTQALDEVITDKLAHIYHYELGGYAYHSSVSIKLLDGDRGRINAQQVVEAIQPDQDWYPNSRLVVIENTCNKGGGCYYELSQLQAISKACKEHQLSFHLDGARIFNALVESGQNSEEVGALFDSISVCLSKGLGAPVGSVLLGDKAFIKKARKVRKVMGGGMRQAGILAAAGIHALDHHIMRLAEDHKRAKALEEALKKQDYVAEIYPVDTNIVIFRLDDKMPGDDFVAHMQNAGILTVQFSPQMIRWVTHLDFTDTMLEQTINACRLT